MDTLQAHTTTGAPSPLPGEHSLRAAISGAQAKSFTEASTSYQVPISLLGTERQLWIKCLAEGHLCKECRCMLTTPGYHPALYERCSAFFNVHRVLLSCTRDLHFTSFPRDGVFSYCFPSCIEEQRGRHVHTQRWLFGLVWWAAALGSNPRRPRSLDYQSVALPTEPPLPPSEIIN